MLMNNSPQGKQGKNIFFAVAVCLFIVLYFLVHSVVGAVILSSILLALWKFFSFIQSQFGHPPSQARPFLERAWSEKIATRMKLTGGIFLALGLLLFFVFFSIPAAFFFIFSGVFLFVYGLCFPLWKTRIGTVLFALPFLSTTLLLMNLVVRTSATIPSEKSFDFTAVGLLSPVIAILLFMSTLPMFLSAFVFEAEGRLAGKFDRERLSAANTEMPLTQKAKLLCLKLLGAALFLLGLALLHLPYA